VVIPLVDTIGQAVCLVGQKRAPMAIDHTAISGRYLEQFIPDATLLVSISSTIAYVLASHGFVGSAKSHLEKQIATISGNFSQCMDNA